MGNVLTFGIEERTASTVSADLISSSMSSPPHNVSPADISEVKISSDENIPTIEQDNINPGTFDDLLEKCKNVFPVIFEGAKVSVNKNLSNHFQVSHTVDISTGSQSAYRFGAMYAGTRQKSRNEVYPLLFGDIDLSGNLNGHIFHLLGQKTKIKFAANIQKSKYTETQFSFDHKGNGYTVSFCLANPDIINMSGVAIGSYLLTVTPNIDYGAELVVHNRHPAPVGLFSALSAAGRYSTDDVVISGKLGSFGLNLSYYQRASKQVEIGVELETNSKESVATFGYKVDHPNGDMCFRGMVNSNWIVGGVLEKKLKPLPFNFMLSATMNHSENKFKLGCALLMRE